MKKKFLLSTLILSKLSISGCNSALMAIDEAHREYATEREKQPAIDKYIALKDKYQSSGKLSADEHMVMAELL
ncbi:hypothetical protein [Psychrobacter piechaudii]|uniref:Lipoprotein n=1 Tax=Psychrobacter piechaudii TaxID=1945521 RepID=A0A1R4GYZ7_9GAMM|nr:hypothetical protein [Psychrobacter piechaudii]SJM73022.1 hypothetical protein A1232T_02223 [Psychrobacter piechaudii]